MLVNNGFLINYGFMTTYTTGGPTFPVAHTVMPTFLCSLSTTGGTQEVGWSAGYVVYPTNVVNILKHYFAQGDVNWISIGY